MVNESRITDGLAFRRCYPIELEFDRACVSRGGRAEIVSPITNAAAATTMIPKPTDKNAGGVAIAPAVPALENSREKPAGSGSLVADLA